VRKTAGGKVRRDVAVAFLCFADAGLIRAQKPDEKLVRGWARSERRGKTNLQVVRKMRANGPNRSQHRRSHSRHPRRGGIRL
jgi:hypothetical protein